MITRKPVSTISYNTVDFLETRIDELIDKGLIDFGAFIKHKPEEDELKEHIHVYLIPSCDVDTKALREEFQEPIPGEELPRGCIMFQSSKFDDWYLYGIHDEAYLASKGQRRKYHYAPSQMRVSDVTFFRELVNGIDKSRFIGMERVKNAVADGMSFSKFVSLGCVPIQLIHQYKMAFDLLTEQKELYRNGRESHTPLVDENGEILDTDSMRF